MSSNLKFEEEEEQPQLLQPSKVMEVDAGESSIRTILWENPMWVEVKRVARRFTVYEKAGGVRAALSWIVGATYVTYFIFMLINAIKFGEAVQNIIMIKLVLLGPLSVLMGYNVIAGERERRSWDLLRTAPLSAAQIVLGKFSGVAATITGFSLLITLPALLSQRYGDRSWFGGVNVNPFVPEVASWIVLMFLCSLSVAVSARCRRSLTALSSSIGLVLSIYVLVPGLASLFSTKIFIDLAVWFWPPELAERDTFHGGSLLLHLVFTVFCLIFAVRSVKALDRKDMQ